MVPVLKVILTVMKPAIVTIKDRTVAKIKEHPIMMIAEPITAMIMDLLLKQAGQIHRSKVTLFCILYTTILLCDTNLCCIVVPSLQFPVAGRDHFLINTMLLTYFAIDCYYDLNTLE